MGALVVLVLLALVAAVVVLVYVAYPYRGHETPVAPSVGRAMRRGVESLPTVPPVDERETSDQELSRTR